MLSQAVISSKFSVSIVEDGQSAPSYVKSYWAWSADYEAPSGYNYPTDISTWSEQKPSQPSNKPACWVKEELYNWNLSTKSYILVQTTYRCETAKPQPFNLKGSVIYVQDSSGFPTSPTPESRAMALVTNDANPYIYLNGSWQRGGEAAAVNDMYIVSNPDATYGGKNIDGHMFFWDGNLWKDMGKVQGPQGPNGQDACSAYISNNTISFDTDHRGKVNGARSATLIDVSYLKGSTRLAPNSISINGYTVYGETQIEQNLFANIATSSSSTTTLALYCKSIYSTVELDLSKGMKNYPVTLSYTGNPDVSTTLYVKGNIPTVTSTDYYYYVTDANSETATDSKTGLALRSVPLSAWSRDAELPTEKYNYIWQKTVVTYSNGETTSSMFRYWRQVTLTPVIKMGTAISGSTISDVSYISGYNFNLKPNNKLQSGQGYRDFYAELWSNGTLCRINKIIVEIIYPDGTPTYVSRQIGAYLECADFYSGTSRVYDSTPKLPFIVNGSETHYANGEIELQSSARCDRVLFCIVPQDDLWMQAFKASGETVWGNPMDDLVYRITLAGTTSTAASSNTALDVVWQTELSLSGSCSIESITYRYTCSDTTSEDIIKSLQEGYWVSNKENVPLGNNNRYLWQRTKTAYKGNYYEYSYSLLETYDVSNLYTKLTNEQDNTYIQESIDLNPKGLVLDNSSTSFRTYSSVKGELPIITEANLILDYGNDYTRKPTISAVVGVMTIVSNPAGTPVMQNWYELKDGKRYVKTYDTTVINNKNYYYINWLPDTYTPTYDSSTGKYLVASVSSAWQVVVLRFSVSWAKDDFLSTVLVDSSNSTYLNEEEFKMEIELTSQDVGGGSSGQYTTAGTFTLSGVETSKYNSIDLSPFFSGTPAQSINKGTLHGLFPSTTAPMLWNKVGGFTTQCGYTWLTSMLPDNQTSSLSYKDLVIDAVEHVSDGSGTRDEMCKYILVLNIQDKITYLVQRYRAVVSSSIQTF